MEKKKARWFLTFHKDHPIGHWIVVSMSGVIIFLIGFFMPNGVYDLNERGLHVFGHDFSTFYYDGLDNFDISYWYPGNYTIIITVGNTWDSKLHPKLVHNLQPYDENVIISCKERINNIECKNGFPIYPHDSTTVEFNIQLNSPREDKYTLCLTTVDRRDNRENNYKETCVNLIMKERP